MKALASIALVLCVGTSHAQQAAPPDARALAATCSGCHGTDGKAVAGRSMPRLAGLPKEHLAAQMRAYRDGTQPATVMHQLAKGYTDPEIDALAAWFAAVK